MVTLKRPNRTPEHRAPTRRALLLGGSAFILGRVAVGAQTPEASPGAGWAFVDDRGTMVELPAQPERVVAEINAASALWDYGVRPVGVFGPQHRADGEVDARVGNDDLASVSDLGEVWGEVDIEGLLALDTDLVVGPTWDPPEIFYLTSDGEAVLGNRVPAGLIRDARSDVA